MNRLTRDEILHRALDMLDSPSLDSKDRPNGAIEAGALSLGWLQDALDLFHNEFPWQGLVRKAAVTLTTAGSVQVPEDFILDIRDGLIDLKQSVRLRRRGLQELIAWQTSAGGPGDPAVYTRAADQLLLYPIPREDRAGTLWYYALPPVLGPSDVPAFPADMVLVDFVRLRGLEWLRTLAPGSARAYADQEIARLRKAGLAGEPESERIPFDDHTWRPVGDGGDGWMGPAIVH